MFLCSSTGGLVMMGAALPKNEYEYLKKNTHKYRVSLLQRVSIRYLLVKALVAEKNCCSSCII